MDDFEKVLRESAGFSPEEARKLGESCVLKSDIDSIIQNFAATIKVENHLGHSLGTEEQKAAINEEYKMLETNSSVELRRFSIPHNRSAVRQWEKEFNVNSQGSDYIEKESYFRQPAEKNQANMTWNQLYHENISAEGNTPALAMSDVLNIWAKTYENYNEAHADFNYKKSHRPAELEPCEKPLADVNDAGDKRSLRSAENETLSPDDSLTVAVTSGLPTNLRPRMERG